MASKIIFKRKKKKEKKTNGKDPVDVKSGGPCKNTR